MLLFFFFSLQNSNLSVFTFPKPSLFHPHPLLGQRGIQQRLSSSLLQEQNWISRSQHRAEFQKMCLRARKSGNRDAEVQLTINIDNLVGGSHKSITTKLAMETTLYNMWREQNDRGHGGRLRLQKWRRNLENNYKWCHVLATAKEEN